MRVRTGRKSEFDIAHAALHQHGLHLSHTIFSTHE